MSQPLRCSSLVPTLKYPKGFQYNFTWPLAKNHILLVHQFPSIPGVFADVSIKNIPTAYYPSFRTIWAFSHHFQDNFLFFNKMVKIKIIRLFLKHPRMLWMGLLLPGSTMWLWAFKTVIDFWTILKTYGFYSDFTVSTDCSYYKSSAWTFCFTMLFHSMICIVIM